MPGNGHEALGTQIVAFLNFCKLEKGLAANTLESYGRDLRRFAGFVYNEAISLGENGLGVTEAIRRYLDRLREEGVGSRSAARHLTTLRNFYTFLQREGKISTD